MPLQTVHLEYFGDPPSILCPACGQQIFAQGTFKANCPHLLFHATSLPKEWRWYDNEAEGYFRQQLAERYPVTAASCPEDNLATLHIDSIIRTACLSVAVKSAFMLALTTSDRGCGGACQGTIYALFDVQPKRSRVATATRTASASA